MGIGRKGFGAGAGALLAALALCSPAAAGQDPVDVIADGGFEQTDCSNTGDLGCFNPYWERTLSFQAYPCFSPPCNPGIAASGSGFLGLGGNVMLDLNEEGSVSQEVDLPEGGSKVLSFKLQAGPGDDASVGTMELRVGGTSLFTRTFADAPADYETEKIDLRGYSGPTEIRFAILCTRVAAPFPVGCDSFFVDDVSLRVGPERVETTFKRTPDRITSRRRARFRFTSNVPDARFRCRLDGMSLGACTSPLRLRVDRGRHRLAVRARSGTDKDPTPAKFCWRVTKR